MPSPKPTSLFSEDASPSATERAGSHSSPGSAKRALLFAKKKVLEARKGRDAGASGDLSGTVLLSPAAATPGSPAADSPPAAATPQSPPTPVPLPPPTAAPPPFKLPPPPPQKSYLPTFVAPQAYGKKKVESNAARVKREVAERMAKLAAAEKNARERELRRKNRVARGPTQDADDDDDDDDGMGGWKAVFIIFLGEAQRTSPRPSPLTPRSSSTDP